MSAIALILTNFSQELSVTAFLLFYRTFSSGFSNLLLASHGSRADFRLSTPRHGRSQAWANPQILSQYPLNPCSKIIMSC